MKVRAKFTCVSKTEKADGYEVEMRPVMTKEEFWKWTPYGELKMGLVVRETADAFEVGADYYLDFTKASE